MTNTANISTVVSIDGTDYSAELGTIEQVALNREDHGVFAISISFDFGGSRQGFGAYALDTYDPETGERSGSAEGMNAVIKMTEVLGDLTKAKGRTCYVLRDAGGRYGFIRGFCSITYPTVYFLPEQGL